MVHILQVDLICFVANRGWSAKAPGHLLLQWQAEQAQTAPLNGSKKNRNPQLSSFRLGFLKTSSSLPYTASTDRISNARRVLNAAQRWLLKFPNWPPRQNHTEATWLIDRGHGEKEIPSGRLDCPSSSLIMPFRIVDKRCSEIKVQGGRPCAVTVGFTLHVGGDDWIGIQ